MSRGTDVGNSFEFMRGGGSWLSVALLCTVLFSATAQAKGPEDFELLLKSKGFDGDFEEKSWQEIEHQLPPAPNTANLIQVDVGALTGNLFFVDEQSVSYGGDEVVRYTLVVTTPGGAKNVSYEGMRCATAERRLYAFGRSDGTWSKAKNNAWVRIQENNLNRQHAALFRDYFCTSGASVMDTASARRVLPKGNPEAVAR